MRIRTLRPLILLPLALGLVLSTTGCSAVENALHKTHEEHFDDRASAVKGWSGVTAPEWLPADSTDIHNLATNDESNSLIVVTSTSPLPEGCEEESRRGIPFDTASWAPKLDRFPDVVQRCGDYEVIRADGVWMGWFTATKAGQKPTPAVTP